MNFCFETKERIANIYEYFKEGSFEELSTGINVTLYDIFNQEISTKIIYSEKIKINWDKEKYIINISYSFFSFKIKLTNIIF